mgnify:CR=1 FL=1
MRLHLFDTQLRIDDLQLLLLIDEEAVEVGRLAQSHNVLAIVFVDGNHPENRFWPIKARYRFAENLIPMTADAG